MTSRAALSDGRLADRVALVTGAASGIGAATVVRLARAGADVAVNVNVGEDGDEVLARVREHGVDAMVVEADVSVEIDVERMFEEVADRLGRVTVCVSNAGEQREASFLDTTFESWRSQMAVNLDATFLVGRAAARQMAGHGGGTIINVTSVHEHITFPGYAPYCAAKAGAGMLTKVMARELAAEGIRVVAVAPGAIASGGNADPDPDERARSEAGIPAHRLGRPEEVAELIAYLASPEAAYITGTTVVIDGALEQQTSTS